MEQDILRGLLAVYIVLAFGLGMAYLYHRRCSTLEMILWGLVALVLPVIGPFFIIAARPGPRLRSRRTPKGGG